MPFYETTFILRQMSQPNTVKSMTRIAKAVMERDGFIQKVEYLGFNQLPYAMRGYDKKHSSGSYFSLQYHLPVNKFESLTNHYKREHDILRKGPYILIEGKKTPLCTLEEEMVPPSYRSEIAKMKEESKASITRKEKRKNQSNSGLDFYPF